MKIDFEKFLADNNLKVGDKIKFKSNDNMVYRITMNFIDKFLYLENVNTETYIDIQYLQKVDFEKVEPKKTKQKKKIGKMTCHEYMDKYKCENCIFNKVGFACGMFKGNESLNYGKEKFFEIHPLAEPLRPILEAELDKEIEE